MTYKILQGYGATRTEQESALKEVMASLKQALTVDSGVVPIEFARDVFLALRDSSVMRKICRNVDMGARTQKMVSISGATATYRGIGQTSADSTIAVNPIQLTARTIEGYSKIANEDIEDLTNIDLYARIAEDLGRAIAVYEDSQIIQGDGATAVNGETQINGLLKRLFPSYAPAAAVGSPTDAGHAIPFVVADALQNLKSVEQVVLESGAMAENLIWLTSHAGYAILTGIEGSDGHPIFKPDPSGKGPGTILGYPVYRTSHVPKNYGVSSDETVAILGDFQNYSAIGTRTSGGGVEVRSDRSVLFATNQTAVRAAIRSDFAIGQTSAFAGLVAIK